MCLVVRVLFSVPLFFDFSLLKREKEIRHYKIENVLTENGNHKLEKKTLITQTMKNTRARISGSVVYLICILTSHRKEESLLRVAMVAKFLALNKP